MDVKDFVAACLTGAGNKPSHQILLAFFRPSFLYLIGHGPISHLIL